MYDEAFAGVYDEIYLGHKDYAREARRVRELARERCPGAATLLDVGCGTGAHLAHLRADFDCAGVDLAEPMVRLARAKLGDAVPVHRADMRSFALDRRFDVVCCLYSAVGYLGGPGDLRAAVRTMARHLVPGGVLVVEPWILAEQWNGGDLVDARFTAGGTRVCRMGRWRTRGGRSVVEMHYLVGDGDGVRHFVDHQELSLFGRAEYEGAFTAAGCTVEHLPDAYADRGVFLGVRLP